MAKLITLSLIICLISVHGFALPLEKSSPQQNTVISESAQKLIEMDTHQNQDANISAEVCLKNLENKNMATSSSSAIECSCIGNSSNSEFVDINQKIVISSNQTASIGYTQPNWLK